jgi:hypothetical protein
MKAGMPITNDKKLNGGLACMNYKTKVEEA